MRNFVNLGEYTRIRTGKLDANASSPNGKYPFFTCSQEPLRIESYSYECECGLVAGNGGLNVKYYNGKFDAYQRTYIIESLDKDKLLPRYMFYFLELYIETLRKESIGGVIKYIKLGNLTNAKIFLPDLATQQKIIDILDKSVAAIARRKKQLASCDMLVKSQFIEMFEGKNYRVIAIGDEFKTTSGGTPARSDIKNYENGVIPWMTSGEVSQGLIYEVKGRITEQGYNASSAKWMPINTVVVAMYGATAGQVGLLKIATTTNQAVCGIMPSEKFNPLFLYYAVKNQKEWMVAQSAGGAQPNISQAVIRRMRVPCPPKEEQNRFAHFAEQTDKSKFRINQSLEKLETLYKALLQKYFG